MNYAEQEVFGQERAFHRASLDVVYDRTDLAFRLRETPVSASCRGAFFNMLDERAQKLGRETHAEYRRFFRIYRYTPFKMFPVRDYLTRLAVLAQIHWGPEGIYQGIRTIQSTAFEAWTSTLAGRAALALVEPSFLSLLRFIERGFSTGMVVNYASFHIEEITPTHVLTRFEHEYNWIQYAMVGALEGVAGLAKQRVAFDVSLETPFDGLVRIDLLRSGS